jgi:hypothetical protein
VGPRAPDRDAAAARDRAHRPARHPRRGAPRVGPWQRVLVQHAAAAQGRPRHRHAGGSRRRHHGQPPAPAAGGARRHAPWRAADADDRASGGSPQLAHHPVRQRVRLLAGPLAHRAHSRARPALCGAAPRARPVHPRRRRHLGAHLAGRALWPRHRRRRLAPGDRETGRHLGRDLPGAAVDHAGDAPALGFRQHAAVSAGAPGHRLGDADGAGMAAGRHAPRRGHRRTRRGPGLADGRVADPARARGRRGPAHRPGGRRASDGPPIACRSRRAPPVR